MKFNLILSTLVGAFALNGALAGEYCPPAPAKCPVECCPDTAGNISVGYDSDYIWKGVRYARDNMWADVNYTFNNLPLTPTVGIWHLTSLGSGLAANDNYGDETNLYAGVALPSTLGFDANLYYTQYLFPTTRGPAGTAANGGDSFGVVTLEVSRDLFCGLVLTYTRDYRFGNSVSDYTDNPLGAAYPYGRQDIEGFFHTLELAKSFCLTDSVGLDLSAAVSYNDNFHNGYEFDSIGSSNGAFATQRNRDSGWHSYYLRAALPIAIGCNATLTPHLSYNGTPDGWIGDNQWSGSINPGANRNDVFHGGVSLSVDF